MLAGSGSLTLAVRMARGTDGRSTIEQTGRERGTDPAMAWADDPPDCAPTAEESPIHRRLGSDTCWQGRETRV